jgi:flagellar export protein FliJ
MHAAASLGVMRAAQRIVLELAGVHRKLDVARAQLIESARQRRAVEILRERRYQQWQTEINKAEADALDELAVIAAAWPDSARNSLHHQQLP